MYPHNISLFVRPPPRARLLRSTVSAVNLLTVKSKFEMYSSKVSSSQSSSKMHQLCSTHALMMQEILLSNDLTFSFISLGNLSPNSPNAHSITDLFDTKFVLNFFCTIVIFCVTLYGMIKLLLKGYALSPKM